MDEKILDKLDIGAKVALGIDIGSTTIKFALLKDGNLDSLATPSPAEPEIARVNLLSPMMSLMLFSISIHFSLTCEKCLS